MWGLVFCTLIVKRRPISEVTEVSREAGWRTDAERLDHWRFLGMLGDTGHRISPIFEVPWLTNEQFRVDWLHSCDQGVAADFAGNILKYVARKFDGANIKDRTKALWQRISGWYSAYDIRDKLPCLTVAMLQQNKKAPKLRASAGCCRALVPFLHEIAQEKLDPANPQEQAMQAAAAALNNCYKCLSSSSPFNSEYLKDQSILFSQQCVALEMHSPNYRDWHIKPKLHMWLELCSEGSKPSLFWCYRDEDYGGTVAALSRSRGGHHGARAMSIRLLTHFLAKQPMVRLR